MGIEVSAIDVWNEMTYEQKLASTSIIFKAIYEHIKDGGTYRYLIYDRIGLNSDAYMLLLSEGMSISNYISENGREK